MSTSRQSSPVASATPRATEATQLDAPKLTTIHAIAQSMAIGPIYSAAIYGAFVAAFAATAGPSVVLMTSIGVLALAWVVAQYGRRFAGAGTVYEYIRGVLGTRAGVGASLCYGFSLLFLGPPFLVPASILFQSFARAHLGFDPPWWVGGVAFMLIVLGMQSLGVALSVRLQLALTCLSAIPIAILVVVIIARGGASGNTLSVFSPVAHGHGDIFKATLFAVTLFIGFECAAALGAETKDPHRAIPRAVIGSVALTAVWFLAIMYAGTIGFGPAHAAAQWGSSPNGLATLAHRYVGSADATLIQLGVLLDMLAVWLAITNSFARVTYALARDRMLPAAWARTSRRGVPYVGNITWVCVTLGMLVATAAAHVGGRYNMLSILVIPGSIVVQLIYALLAVVAVRLVAPGWRWLLLVLAAAVPVLGIYGTVHPFPTGPYRWGIWLTVIGLLAALLWMARLQFGPGRPFASSAVAAEPGGGAPLDEASA